MSVPTAQQYIDAIGHAIGDLGREVDPDDVVAAAVSAVADLGTPAHRTIHKVEYVEIPPEDRAWMTICDDNPIDNDISSATRTVEIHIMLYMERLNVYAVAEGWDGLSWCLDPSLESLYRLDANVPDWAWEMDNPDKVLKADGSGYERRPKEAA